MRIKKLQIHALLYKLQRCNRVVLAFCRDLAVICGALAVKEHINLADDTIKELLTFIDRQEKQSCGKDTLDAEK